jgi:hypothetical protein
VVIGGADGSGKTTLINRCVALLQELRADHVLTMNVHVADLTQVIPWGPPDPTDSAGGERAVTDRAKLVVDNLCEEIEDQIGLSHQESDEFKKSRTPQIAYRSLSRFLVGQHAAHKGTNVIVVLLPPTTAFPRELINYSRAVSPHIVFLAETSLPRRRWEAGVLSGPSSLSVRLDNLDSADYELFAKNRMARHDERGGSADTPRIPARTMQELADERGQRPMTISELQAALYLTYEDHISGAGRITEVTVDAIARTFLRHSQLGQV